MYTSFLSHIIEYDSLSNTPLASLPSLYNSFSPLSDCLSDCQENISPGFFFVTPLSKLALSLFCVCACVCLYSSHTTRT